MKVTNKTIILLALIFAATLCIAVDKETFASSLLGIAVFYWFVGDDDDEPKKVG